jgi:hypothetical protein
MRPPKSVRSRLREAGDWSTPCPTPPKFSLTDQFASQTDDVHPVPGANTPVFNFSADHERRVSEFTLSPEVFDKPFSALSQVIFGSPEFERMLGGAGLTAHEFLSGICSTSCLALAVHFARIHSIMNTDHTRFSVLPEIELPVGLSDYIRSIGEFTGPDGREWVLHDYVSTVRSLARASYYIHKGCDWCTAMQGLWLPTDPDDGNTAFVVSKKLSDWFLRRGLHITVEELISSVFTGSIPAKVSALLSSFSGFDKAFVVRVFTPYSTEREFLSLFGDETGAYALDQLGLSVGLYNEGSLLFGREAFSLVTPVHRVWSNIARSLASVLGVSFSRAIGHMPRGDKMQISYLTGTDPVFSIHSYYGLLPEEMSFLCCYGSPLLFSNPIVRSHDGFIPATSQLVSIFRYDLGL